MQESLGHLNHLQEATSCHRNRADKSEKWGQMWSLNGVQIFLGNAMLLLEEIIGLRASLGCIQYLVGELGQTIRLLLLV